MTTVMTRVLTLALMLAGTHASLVAADFTVKNYKLAMDIKRRVPSPDVMDTMVVKTYEMYVAGIGSAFNIANEKLKMLNRPPLYCMSSNAGLLYVALLENVIEKFNTALQDGKMQKAQMEEIDQISLSMLLLTELIDRYPCKPQSAKHVR